MPSYEGVLSPSLSVENDSNHSLDVTPTTPDVHSMNSITEESSKKGIIELRSEPNAVYDIDMGLLANENDPTSGQGETTAANAMPQTTLASRTNSTNSRSNSSSMDYSITKGHTLSIDTGLIAVESIDDLPPLTIECVSQEPPVVVSTSSATKVAKKKPITTDASSG